MTERYWILAPDGQTAVTVTHEEWGDWFEKADRVLFQTMVGKRQISTVFLGIDHNFSGKGPPLLWETMVFGGNEESFYNEEICLRYATYEQALAGHIQTIIEITERYGGESE